MAGAPPQYQGIPQQGYAPPPQGYAPPLQGYAPPPQGYIAQQQPIVVQGGYQSVPDHHHHPPAAYDPHHHHDGQKQQTLVIPVYNPNPGPCAAGGGHDIHEEFTCCGLCLGIVFFPLGLICCLTMKDKQCARCGLKFS